MSQEVVQVGIRVRGLIPREVRSGKSRRWNVESNRIWSEEDIRQKVYRFDHVWDSSARNADVYELLCRHIISSAFHGFNGTIFAYGQTSSGKTHTMMGDEDEPGIIPKSIDGIFDLIETTPMREFLLRVSYYEIYNENVVDLLAKDEEGKKRSSLQLKEDPQGNVLVDGAIERMVTSPEEVIQCLLFGEQHRHIGATNMNERSSRSHTIFRLIIESSEVDGGESDGAIMVSHLNLVDLAGSERVAQAGTGGKSLREGGNINKSLLVLSQVISKLSEGSQEFVPFRDSKLTRILKTSLGGNARTAIICTVTPVEREQTKSTLEFASRAKSIVQHARVNEVLDDQALLRRLKKEISALQSQLAEERGSDRKQLEQEFKSVLSEKDRQMEERERAMAAEREKLRRDMEGKEQLLQELSDRLLSGEASSEGPNNTLLESKKADQKTLRRRETWAPALSRRTTRRMSFFPKFLTNNKENIELDAFEDPDDSSVFDNSGATEHGNFITERTRRKTVRFGLTSINNLSEEEISPIALSTPPSVLRKEVKRLSRLLESSQRELSELSEFTQLESKLKENSPQKSLKELREELRNANKSKTDLEGLYMSANKELHEAKLKVKALEDDIHSIKEENSTKESLKDELSKMLSSYETSENEKKSLARSLKEVQDRLMFLKNEKEDFEFRFQLSEDKFKKKELELIQSLNEARGQIISKNSSDGSPNTSTRSESNPFGDVTLNAIEELTKRLEALQNYVNDLENEVRLNKEANAAKDAMIDELNDKNSSDGQQSNAELLSEISSIKSLNEKKDDQILSLQNELKEALEDQLKKDPVSSTEDEILQLKTKLTESQEKIVDLEDNAIVVLNDYETLEKDKAELEKDNSVLQSRIDTLERSELPDEKGSEMKSSLDKLRVELQSVKDEKKDLDNQCREKEAQLQQLKSDQSSETTDLQSKLDCCLNDVNKKDATISTLSTESETLKSQLEGLSSQIENLNELNAELELKVSGLKSDLSAKYVPELDEMKSALEKLTHELQSVKDEKKALTDLVDEKETQLRESYQKLMDKDCDETTSLMQSKLDGCLVEINEKDETITSLSTKCEALNAQVESLNMEIDGLKSNFELKVSALVSDLSEKSSLESMHKKMSEELSVVKVKSAEKDDQLHEIKSALKECSLELQSVKDEKEDQLQECREKLKSFNEKKSEASHMESNLQDCLNELNEKNDKISSLSSECESLNCLVERHNLQINELSGFKSKLEHQVSTLKSDLIEKTSSEFEHQKMSEERLEKLSLFEAQSEKKEEELTETKSALKEISLELQSVKDEKESLHNLHHEKENQLQECLEKLKSFNEKSSEASHMKSNLQDCLNELNEKNDKISSLSSECESLNCQVEQLNLQINELSGFKSKFEHQVSTLKSDLIEKTSTEFENQKMSEELLEKLSLFEAQSERKEEELAEAKSALRELSLELQSVKDEKEGLDNLYNEKDNELQKLKSFSEKNSEASHMKANLQDCLSELKEKNDKISSLSSECESLNCQVERLNLQINELSGFQSKLEHQVSTLKSDLIAKSSSESEHTKISEKLSVLSEQSEKKNEELRSALSKLTLELQSVKDEKKELEDYVHEQKLNKLNDVTESMKKEFQNQSESIKSLQSQLSSLQEVEADNNRLLSEIKECKEQNRHLQNQISKALLESKNNSELEELKESLKESNLKSMAMEVQLVYKDKEIDKIKKDLSFMMNKSNAYRDELRKVQNQNLDTTVYNNVPKAVPAKMKGEAEPNQKEDATGQSLAITPGDLASELYLKVKERELQRLRKEIDDRIAHEKTLMAAYHKWKMIAKDHEEELNDLKKKTAAR